MNDRSGPDPLDPAFWQDVARQASHSATFKEGAQHLCDMVVELRRGSHAVRLLFDRGTTAVDHSDKPVVLQLAGQDWHPLLDGRVHYYHAINPHFGSIEVKGDSLAAGWMLPSLSALFRIATKVWAARGNSTDESGQ